MEVKIDMTHTPSPGRRLHSSFACAYFLSKLKHNLTRNSSYITIHIKMRKLINLGPKNWTSYDSCSQHRPPSALIFCIYLSFNVKKRIWLRKYQSMRGYLSTYEKNSKNYQLVPKNDLIWLMLPAQTTIRTLALHVLIFWVN